MNKKLSTFLFIIGGTLLNLLLMGILSFGLWILSIVVLQNLGYSGSSPIAIAIQIAAIFGGLVLAFVIYSRIQKFIQKKFDLEKYLEPIFGRKRR